MKAIETRFLGPTQRRCARIVATDSDNNRVTISYDYTRSGEAAHRVAARALCKRMGWTGRLVGGALRRGYVFVFRD